MQKTSCAAELPLSVSSIVRRYDVHPCGHVCHVHAHHCATCPNHLAFLASCFCCCARLRLPPAARAAAACPSLASGTWHSGCPVLCGKRQASKGVRVKKTGEKERQRHIREKDKTTRIMLVYYPRAIFYFFRRKKHV